jgi:hypothetical protein
MGWTDRFRWGYYPTRAKLWWTAAIVAVVAVASAVVALVWPDEKPPPEYQVHRIEGFPEYDKGTRVVAAKSSELPSKSIRFSFVPTRIDLTIIARCDLEPDKFVRMAITVNGRDIPTDDCDSARWSKPFPIDGYDLVVGRETWITAALSGYGVPPAQGAFGVAVTEPVPTEKYPYPPRPAVLVDLAQVHASSSAAYVRSSGPAEATITWKQGVLFSPRLNTPGKLRILLDGKPADECESWDYEYRTCSASTIDGVPMWKGLQFAAGQQVKVTVVAERTTGDWEVGIDPY